jgi:THO complex subunit 2
MDVTQSMLPAKAWQAFSPEMYLTFWSLSLYDLYVPVERYQSEFKRKASEMKVRLALPPSLVVPRLQTSEA